MSQSHIISPYNSADEMAVERLLDVNFGIDRRVKTSYRLREGSFPAPHLSLVVRDDAVGLAGTISYWPLRIGLSGHGALMLGPLAVHPLRQNLGIGLALMKESLMKAKTLGHRLVLLVGDAPYYARVGFQKLPNNDILLPGPVNRQRFLFLELAEGALDGVKGLALPPWRFAEVSAAFAEPH